MKKNLLATAVTAATATLSAGAFAAVTVTTADASYPLVAPGGTVVFENQIITETADSGTELEDGDKIVMSLPTGVNFSGTPVATASGSVKLEANSLGDPGSVGIVTLADTNGDGGMDRMQVVVAVNAVAGDTITITGALTNGTAKSGNLSPTIFIEDASPTTTVELLDTDNVLATATTSVSTPIMQRTTDTGLTIRNVTNAALVTTPTAGSLLLTLTDAADTGETVVITLGSGIRLDAGTTITVTSLTDGAPALNVTAPADGASTITLTLAGNVARDSQYLIAINGFETTALTSPGAVTGTLSGTAGVTGSATLAVLANPGSTAALAALAKATDLVAGADDSQTLPSVTITENFGGDLASGETVTILAGTGLVFDATVTPTVSANGDMTFGAVTVTTTKITIPITASAGTADVVTVSGAKATAASTASGPLTVQVGDDEITGESDNVPEAVLTVANAIPPGAVTIAGPTTIDLIGKGATGVVDTITLTEGTYGAITNRNATSTSSAYIQIIPPAGVTITGVTESATNDLDISNVGVAATPADGSYILTLNGESATKSVSTITVTYNVASTVATGTDVVFTIAGNTGASGTAKVATVAATTKTTVGAIPSVDPGSVNAQTLAPFTITENFATALSTGEFRLIAPQGVTFTGTVTGSSSVATTFNANDTLILPVTATGAVDAPSYTPRAIISSNVAVDSLLTFTIADGDGGLDADASTSATGLVGGTVNLAYTGDVDTLEAGAAAAVNVGFQTTRAIVGGLAPFTVTTSDDDVVGVSVDGRDVELIGVAAGSATITVTDALGSNDSFTVTAATPAGTQDELTGITTTDGSTSTAVLSAGATTDQGATYETEFTTGDEVTIVATIQPDAADVGEAGELFIVVRSQEGDSDQWLYMDEDGNFQVWDTMIASLEPAEVVDSLDTVHYLQIFEGEMAAGTHKVFIGYRTEGGPIVYNSIPLTITVTE